MPCNQQMVLKLADLRPEDVLAIVSGPDWVRLEAGLWCHRDDTAWRVQIQQIQGKQWVRCTDPARLRREVVTYKVQAAAARYGWRVERRQDGELRVYRQNR